jgi:hypothetical protein
LQRIIASAINESRATNPKSIEGIYKHGKVELLETPEDVDEARVIVTFIPKGSVELAQRGIDETDALNLRARLATFAEDWERPEMGAYDAL